MNQMITPEATYASALEYIKMNDEDNAILIINDFILNSKKKFWTLNHEMIIGLYIDLLVKKNKQKMQIKKKMIKKNLKRKRRKRVKKMIQMKKNIKIR